MIYIARAICRRKGNFPLIWGEYCRVRNFREGIGGKPGLWGGTGLNGPGFNKG